MSKSKTKKTNERNSGTAASSEETLVRVLFQSRSADITSGDRVCAPEMVLMNPADMRAHLLRAGTSIALRSSTEDIASCNMIFQVWPSNKTSAGFVTLNRIWWPNFDKNSTGDSRPARLSRGVSSLLVLPATRVHMRVQAEPNILITLAEQLPQFCDYVRGLSCAGAILRIGQQLGATWRTQPVLLTVVSAFTYSSEALSHSASFLFESESAHADDGSEKCYRPTAATAICFDLGSNRNQNADLAAETTTANSNTSDINSGAFLSSTKGNNRSQQQNDCTIRGSASDWVQQLQALGFGGYDAEAVSVLRTALAALSIEGTHSTSTKSRKLDIDATMASADSPAMQPSTHTPVVSLLESQLFAPPRGLLLHGPPGTGKTLLMHAIVAILRKELPSLACIELHPRLLLQAYSGDAEKSLIKSFTEARLRAPCIILMDDVEILCKTRASVGGNVGAQAEAQQRLLTCLLTQIDGSTASRQQGVFVLAASNRPNDIDSAMRRPGRLEIEVELSVPTAKSRIDILRAILLAMGVQECNGSVSNTNDAKQPSDLTAATIESVACGAHGFVGSDLLQGVKEAFLCASTRMADDYPPLKRLVAAGAPSAVDSTSSELQELTSVFNALQLQPANPIYQALQSQKPMLSNTDLRQGIRAITPSALREAVIEVPTVHWNDIGGMQSVKQALREVVEWPLLYPHLFQELGLAPPQGVLLYGPPGCSKTLMAKALATESGMNFLSVRGPELLSKWLGESEKAIQTLFRRARAASPCIVFFDEIDALAGKRGATSAGVSDRVLAQLLSELDGVSSSRAITTSVLSDGKKTGPERVQVILVAATNRPDMLDAALMRPGRIDRKVYVPPPDEESRQQIFEIELKKMPCDSSIDVKELTRLSGGFSGAEVVAVIAEAAMLAIDENQSVVSMAYLLRALHSIQPQITQDMLRFYQSLQF